MNNVQKLLFGVSSLLIILAIAKNKKNSELALDETSSDSADAGGGGGGGFMGGGGGGGEEIASESTEELPEDSTTYNQYTEGLEYVLPRNVKGSIVRPLYYGNYLLYESNPIRYANTNIVPPETTTSGVKAASEITNVNTNTSENLTNTTTQPSTTTPKTTGDATGEALSFNGRGTLIKNEFFKIKKAF
jgi:hypothetical protein